MKMNLTNTSLRHIGASLALCALAPIPTWADDHQDDGTPSIIETLEELGLDAETIEEIESGLAEKSGEATKAAVKSIHVDASSLGEASAKVRAQLKKAGLEGDLADKIESQIKAALEGFDIDDDGNATKSSVKVEAKSFVVGPDGEMKEIDLEDGDLDIDIDLGLSDDIEAKIRKMMKRGAGADHDVDADVDFSFETKGFVVGPDGEMKEIGGNAGDAEALGEMLGALLKIDGDAKELMLDLDLGGAGGVLGIGPAVIVGGDEDIEIDIEDLADIDEFSKLLMSPAAGGVGEMKAELDEIREELAAQRALLEKILEKLED